MTKEEKKAALRQAIWDVVASTALAAEPTGGISDASFNALRLLVEDYNLLDPTYDPNIFSLDPTAASSAASNKEAITNG